MLLINLFYRRRLGGFTLFFKHLSEQFIGRF